MLAEIENISEKNKKITTNNQYKALLDQIDIAEIQNSVIRDYESYDELQAELGSVQALATGAQRTLKKLEELKEICPTCKQPIDVSAEKAMIDVERRKHEEALERVSEIKPRIIQIKENNAEFERNVKAQKDWEDLLRSFDQSVPRNILDKY